MINLVRAVLLCSVSLLLAHCQDGTTKAQISGPYLGQTPPVSTPQLFAPGIVSTDADELNATFRADGGELYFSRKLGGQNTLMVVLEDNGRWTEPTVAPFSGTYGDVDPFLSSDGRRLFFSSRRPLGGTGASKDADLWYVERSDDGLWGDPIHIPEVSVPGQDDYYTSIDAAGTLYFSRFDANGFGNLYRSESTGRSYSEPELILGPVNTDQNEHDPFIAPDGSFLIFSSNRAGGYGRNDLYVSFRGDGGQWLEPRNMGGEINSPGYDYCPNLSHDGRYLFFSREVEGRGDIYWVNTEVIDVLMPN